MPGFRPFIGRYQMVIFLFLTYLISWAVVIPMEGALIPHGPLIAAFIVLALVSGRQGAAGLWRQMTRGRVGWKWYLIAPGLLLAAHVCALALNLALGARIASTAHLQTLPALLGIVIPLVFLGGQWEEPGWLGYALRRLNERFPHAPLSATLAAGVIRMVWHTPLLLASKIPWYDYLFFSLAIQILLTWLYHRTGGSVLIPMLAHLSSNVLFASLAPLFSGAERDQYWMLMVAAESVIALGLVIATRGRLGRPGEVTTGPAILSSVERAG